MTTCTIKLTCRTEKLWKPQAELTPHSSMKPAASHAQDTEAGFQFWMGILGRALVQLAGTPESPLPWLTEEIDRPETHTALMLTDPAPVCPSAVPSARRSCRADLAGSPAHRALRTLVKATTCAVQRVRGLL